MCPHMPFFYKKNIFSTRLAFCMLRTAKKAAKGTRACLRSSSSALATVIQLSTPRRGRSLNSDLRSCACLAFILIAIGIRMKLPRKFGGYGSHRRHNRHAHFGMPHRALGARNFKTDSVVSAWRGVVPSWEMVQAGFLRLCGSHPKNFLQKPDLETTWIWRAEQIKLGI